jgi:hypothetical protein
MKRVWLIALSGAIATATAAFVAGDASAQYYGSGVGVAAYQGVYSPGVYRRTARRAYRRAAYAGVDPGVGVGWNNAAYWGTAGSGVSAASVAVGATASGSAPGYNAYAAYGGNTGSHGDFSAGTYRRTGELYAPAVQTSRVGARYMAAAARNTTAAWTQYPTRGEYARGYVTPGYYGPQCNPLLDPGCH